MDAKYTLQDLKEAFEIGREIEYRKSYYLTGESFENKCSEIINRASDGGQVDSKPANCAIFDVNNLVCPINMKTEEIIKKIDIADERHKGIAGNFGRTMTITMEEAFVFKQLLEQQASEHQSKDGMRMLPY